LTTFVSEIALVFGRYARQTLRSRMQILFGALMPLLYLLFYGPLLAGVPLGSHGSSWQMLVPGLLLQLGPFGAGFSGFGILIEKQHGVVERMRVTPVSRLALLLGRVLRDAALLVFQAVLVVLVALVMGLRAPLPGILIGLGFVAAMTVSLASLSYALAMRVATPQAFAPLVNAVNLPAMLLSGLMLPMTLAPGWLNVLSHFMPFRYLVDAVRAAFVGDYGGTAMLYGLLVTAALLLASVATGTHLFRRAGA
jgi:ABC-2 type transport system permease protein